MKQKDRSWSDDYSPFTRPTSIKGRQGTFEAKREKGRWKKRQISERIKQTRPGRLPGQKSVKRKSGSRRYIQVKRRRVGGREKEWEREKNKAREENKGEGQARASGRLIINWWKVRWGMVKKKGKERREWRNIADTKWIFLVKFYLQRYNALWFRTRTSADPWSHKLIFFLSNSYFREKSRL